MKRRHRGAGVRCLFRGVERTSADHPAALPLESKLGFWFTSLRYCALPPALAHTESPQNTTPENAEASVLPISAFEGGGECLPVTHSGTRRQRTMRRTVT
jgi:hypothetical protein